MAASRQAIAVLDDPWKPIMIVSLLLFNVRIAATHVWFFRDLRGWRKAVGNIPEQLTSATR